MRSLNLTDKQEKLYALIWKVTNSGAGQFTGTAKYVAEWIGCKERQAKKIIRQLEDRGLLAHEVVRTIKKTYTIFWSIDPEDAKIPEKGSKEKIDWIGRTPKCPTDRARKYPTERAPECPTDNISIYSRNRNKKSSGGERITRSRAKGTTTTGFLFENNGSGLAAGKSISLPYEQGYFREAWERLLRQPAWAAKTADALELELRTLGDVQDAIIAAYCCELAVKKGWDTIKDPAKVYEDDIEQVETFGEICKAREEGAGK